MQFQVVGHTLCKTVNHIIGPFAMNLEQLKTKLIKLIGLDPEGNYGYINEALSEEEVSAFENRHGIRFPADYRTFITNLFDGGVGPYQIMPLSFWDSVHNTVYLDSIGNQLNEPFLLTEDWNEDRFPDEEVDHRSIVNGTIRLCHTGCGNFLFLVVNGEEYGNIWIDDRASNNEIVPLTDKQSGKRINFETWYNTWLDESIAYHEEKAGGAQAEQQ